MSPLLSGISPTVNDSVRGRGLRHRKLTPQERIALAADVAMGKRPFEPSLAQSCSLLNVSIAAVRAEIKARGIAGALVTDWHIQAATPMRPLLSVVGG
jgi:hypothetical protein